MSQSNQILPNNKAQTDSLNPSNCLKNNSYISITQLENSNNLLEAKIDRQSTQFSDFSEEEYLSILQKDEDFGQISYQHLQKNKQDSAIASQKNNKCSCSKSKCLRLNCSCFKNQGYCSQECGCIDCLNSQKYEKVRNFVLEKTKFISRASFQEKTVVFRDQILSKNRCKCNKGCNKLYCSCFKANGKCSTLCKCVNCENDKVYLDREEALQIYDYLPRKKYKIVINFKDQKKDKKIVQKICSVMFKNYQDDQNNEKCLLQTTKNIVKFNKQLIFFQIYLCLKI